ncbi:MAG: RNB domain-containing ribonuclease, partial [Pseudomonadota bacterium]
MNAKRINTRKHTKRKHAKVPGEMPSREDILAFVADNPGRAGKREIARHFGIIGGARIHLKKMLKDLSEEGLIEKRNKRMIRPGDLPPVFVARLFGRDSDGDLLGVPVDWDEEGGDPPNILVLSGKTKATQPGVGDRALVRLTEAEAGPEAEHVARVIKVLEKKQGAILGIFRKRDGDRLPYLEPIDRKQRELDVDPADLKEADDGDLVSVQVTRSGRYGHPRASIVERFGSMNSEKAISEIALQSHGIPHVFPAAVEAQAEASKPVGTLGKREDWRQVPLITIDPPDAKDHDDAVFAEPDDNPENSGGHVVYVAIADVAHYV